MSQHTACCELCVPVLAESWLLLAPTHEDSSALPIAVAAGQHAWELLHRKVGWPVPAMGIECSHAARPGMRPGWLGRELR